MWNWVYKIILTLEHDRGGRRLDWREKNESCEVGTF